MYLPSEIWERIWFFHKQPVNELEEQEEFIEESYLQVNSIMAEIRAFNFIDQNFPSTSIIERGLMHMRLDILLQQYTHYKIIYNLEVDKLDEMWKDYLDLIIN